MTWHLHNVEDETSRWRKKKFSNIKNWGFYSKVETKIKLSSMSYFQIISWVMVVIIIIMCPHDIPLFKLLQIMWFTLKIYLTSKRQIFSTRIERNVHTMKSNWRGIKQHFPSNGKMIDALHHHHHSQISYTSQKRKTFIFFSISVKKLINFSSCLFSSSSARELPRAHFHLRSFDP